MNTSAYDAIPDATHPLVDPAWLAGRLDDPTVVVLDASTAANDPGGVRIPGARRFDIDTSASDQSTPLPHTMLGAGDFQALARRLGIDDDSTVIVYDTREIFSAARAWWCLRAMGHNRVAVLDGGLAAWRAAGHPVEPITADADADHGGTFTARPRAGAIVDADHTAAALGDDDRAVIDARSHARFTGEAPEPREGLRLGHMPGAGNVPYTDVQREGALRPAAELAPLFEAAARGRRRLVFSCGSGVTACVSALGAVVAGYDADDLAVYDGSWTEWAAPDSGRPIVTGEA